MHDFTFYSDPGHGWLQVTDADLEALELKPSDFSARGQFVQRKVNGTIYLEEDRDAPQFLAAWERKHGRKAVLREVYLSNRAQRGIR